MFRPDELLQLLHVLLAIPHRSWRMIAVFNSRKVVVELESTHSCMQIAEKSLLPLYMLHTHRAIKSEKSAN